ncbi:MAG: hypothetical protein SF162_06995 [bacterium]|nr:hypothetical protein [bacterium]
MKRVMIVFALLLAVCLPAAGQQEGVDLPADLFVLLNDGSILRYGVGASGVTQISPGGEFAVDFGVDDRGSRLAYRTEAGLFLRDLNAPDGQAAAPLQIEDSAAGLPAYRGRGESIAFSPTASEVPGGAVAYTLLEGFRVAYLSGTAPTFQTFMEGIFTDLRWSPTGRYLAGETDQNVWWIYRREGDTLSLTSVIVSSIGTAWVSPNEIVFAPVDGGLKIMNLDLANQQTDLLDASVEYRLPTLTADDNLDFFGRSKADTAIPEGYGLLLRLRRGADSLDSIGQTPIELTGLRWVPGGALMIAFQAGVLAVFDPATGFGFPLPLENVVAYAWGPLVPPDQRAPAGETAAPQVSSTLAAPNPVETPTNTLPPTPQPISTAVGMNLPAALYFNAQDGFGVAQVWRLPANSRPPERLTFAPVDVSEYAHSADGRAVYYASDGTIWIQRADIGFPIALQDLTSFAPVDLSLSPDGTRLAFADEQLGISTLIIDLQNPSSSTLERLLPNDQADGVQRTFTRARWSPQGDRLLIEAALFGGDVDGFAVGVYDLASAQVFLTAPFDAGDPRTANARWLRDGRILAHADANSPQIAPGFYVFGTISAASQPILAAALPPDQVVRADVEIADGVLRALVGSVVDASAPLQVVEVDLDAGSLRAVAAVDPVIGAPRFSADGRFLVGFRRDPAAQAAGSTDRGALMVFEIAAGRYTVINPVDGLADVVWNVSF